MRKCLQKITARTNVIFSYIKDTIDVQGILYLKGLPIYILMVSYITLLAFMTDRYIEAVFQVLAFLCLRYKFNSTYHANNTITCCFITFSVISFIIPTTPILGHTLFGGIFSAFIVTFLSWLAQYVIELRKPKQFNISTCTREEFIQRCREVNLNSDNTKIAIQYFYDKSVKLWDIANEYSIDYDSAKRRTIRIKHKLTDK